jgi:hypothetical protein
VRAHPIAALLLLVALGAAADEPAPADEPASELFADDLSVLDLFDRARELRPRISLRNESTVELPHDDAHVDSFAERLRVSVAAPLGPSIVVRLQGQLEATLFDFDGDRRFLDTGRRSGDPFDELLSNDFSLEGRYAVNEDLGIVGALSYESSWERGARYADGIELDGVLGFSYVFRNTLSLVAGAKAGSRIGGSVSFSPVVRVGWRVTDRIEIQTEPIGLRVTAKVTNKLALYLSGRRSSQSWDLENRGGSVGKARLRDRKVPILLGARWKLTKHWRLRGFVGAIAYQKYSVRDDDGDTIDREKANGPAFTFQARVDYRF